MSGWGSGPDHPRPCRKWECEGTARVQIAYAPDTGWHWLKCDECGDEWNPGSVRG